MGAGFEAVIGLEVHVQLRTRSKMFCACENAFGGPPNVRTCPVCLGLPGALPVPNQEAVRMAVLLGHALGAEIREESWFYRKQYFYPDLPKGFQITQGPVAVVEGGSLEIPGDPEVRGGPGPLRIRIERAHLEEDAGKNFHGTRAGETWVDLNRAGVPLLEIVGAPDLRSPREAQETLKVLHRLVTALGICDGNMEEGAFRCDANISLRPGGQEALGTRVEIKNLNSFNHLRRALAYEVARQTALLNAGEKVGAETRGWDASSGETLPQRGKEAAMDYRYFPEPDLPPLRLHRDWIQALRSSLPELPEARRARWTARFELGPDETATLAQSPEFADYFDRLAEACGDGRSAANWMLGDLSRVLNARGGSLEALGLEPGRLGELLRLVSSGRLSLSSAREQVFPRLFEDPGSPGEIAERLGLSQVRDPEFVAETVRGVLAAHPAQAAQLRQGKEALRGFLVGKVLKAGGGRLDPVQVHEILAKELARD
ncbi:MAG: Asp-tRNA(Asn)/Glu-tRNA(Gln) amidotransferase subunit GatB [Acidobacteria bacterium]|nr:Asp-tRNA(Asn)/Glu-tRNA(Gln) amidotransferase subunit GatB [Acidobacteriota bacterium]